MFDLLNDRIAPIESGGEQLSLTLPELFSQFGRDGVDSFPGLAAHQAQAWYQIPGSARGNRATPWRPG